MAKVRIFSLSIFGFQRFDIKNDKFLFGLYGQFISDSIDYLLYLIQLLKDFFDFRFQQKRTKNERLSGQTRS